MSEKNRPKCSSTIFLSKSMHNLYFGKKWPKTGGYFCHFFKSTLSKQSPIGRKFAQSGHAGSNQFTMVLLLVLLQVCPPESVMAF
jgi:hypothetical protein